MMLLLQLKTSSVRRGSEINVEVLPATGQFIFSDVNNIYLVYSDILYTSFAISTHSCFSLSDFADISVLLIV